MKSVPAIHQLVAGFDHGDAISNEAIVLQRLFRSWGFRSEIYCLHRQIEAPMRLKSRDLSQAATDCGPDDVVILHLSIGSPANDVLPTLRSKKAILYHNVTPPSYFKGFNETLRAQLEQGIAQTRALAGRVDLAMAVSDFNARELAEAGHRDVRTIPLLLDQNHGSVQPDPAILREYGDGKLNVLFVGRVVPNKRIEDLLCVFDYLKRFETSEARLLLVGRPAEIQYHALLRAKAKEWDLGTDVRFIGSVSQSHLNAYYQSAHVFLCMSEHEGFCAPLLEAMYHRVPVLALARAAIPETLDGAGVLVHERDYALMAALAHRLGRDGSLREPVIEKQLARLEAYKRLDLHGALRQHLSTLIPIPLNGGDT